VIGQNQMARRAWIETIISGRKDLLAVHTLRNWTTAASFLASTAIIISLGVINAVYSTDGFSEAAQVLNILGQKDLTTWTVKLFALLILFISAFFNFSLAIRSFNHVAYLVTVMQSPQSVMPKSAASDELAQGSFYYTLGMRSYYLSVPIAFWLFGPIWMLGSAIVLLAGLWRMDYTRPKSARSEAAN